MPEQVLESQRDNIIRILWESEDDLSDGYGYSSCDATRCIEQIADRILDALAAPDLLVVCKLIVAGYDCHEPGECGENCEYAGECHAVAAYAAITKVEGKEAWDVADS